MRRLSKEEQLKAALREILEQDIEVVKGKVDWKGREALKHKHGGIRSAAITLVAFAFENIATLSLAVNLASYFIGILHMELADAANSLTNFMGTGFLLSIVVAVFADTVIGRFNATVISGCIEFLALVLLAVQAHVPGMKPPPCNPFSGTATCKQMQTADSAFLFIALYLLAIGQGGMKAALPAHGADQFDNKDPKEATNMSSYFNGALLAICIGGAISLLLCVWVQDHKGWDWGFALAAFAMLLGVTIFVTGLPTYRIHVIDGTSALLDVIQVFVAAFRNRNLELPTDPMELYEIGKDREALAAEVEETLPHRDVYRFLDKAAIRQTPGGQAQKPSPSSPCSVTQVENAKIILGLVPVFCCTIIMTLCLAQLQTFSVQQARTMDTSITNSINIPPASLPIIPIAFLIVLIPFYDRIAVPILRKMTGIPTGITHLQRIGVGLILSALSMATAAIIESKRKQVAREHNMLDAIPGSQPLPLTVFWLSFQYFIFGVADLFTYVGLLEFFYSEAPKALKSVSTCFLWISMALGYYLSSVLVKIVNAATKDVTRSRGWLGGNNINRNNLNLFFWLIAGLSLINFVVYMFVARMYKYRPKNLNLEI